MLSIILYTTCAVNLQTSSFISLTVHFACGSKVLCSRFPKTFARCANVLGKQMVSSALLEPALSVVEWGDIRFRRRTA